MQSLDPVRQEIFLFLLLFPFLPLFWSPLFAGVVVCLRGGLALCGAGMDLRGALLVPGSLAPPSFPPASPDGLFL